jgi:hypothetical protein
MDPSEAFRLEVIEDHPSAATQEIGIRAVPMQPGLCKQMPLQWIINFLRMWARLRLIWELHIIPMVHAGKIAHKSPPALRDTISSQGRRVARYHRLKVGSQAKNNLESRLVAIRTYQRFSLRSNSALPSSSVLGEYSWCFGPSLLAGILPPPQGTQK